MKILLQDNAYRRLEIERKLSQASFDSESCDEGFEDEDTYYKDDNHLATTETNDKITEKIIAEKDDENLLKKRKIKQGVIRKLRKGTKNFGMSIFGLLRFRSIFGRLRKTRKYQSMENLL